MNTTRIRTAFKAFGIHFGISLLVAALVALLVFTIWYPYPFRELAGGRDLFILVIAVDIICGPLLTSILFSPTKPKKELITDISLVVIVQLLALGYGIWNVWLARPVYLVNTENKFYVVTNISVKDFDLQNIPLELQPKLLGGPLKVSLRDGAALDYDAMDAFVKSGKDKTQIPTLYSAYDGSKAYQNSQLITNGLFKITAIKTEQIETIAKTAGLADIQQLRFAYVIGQDAWYAFISPNGEIIGYSHSK